MQGELCLPQKYLCYKRMFEVLKDTSPLFQLLFQRYQICMKCIFRLYGFQTPKLYSDTAYYAEILPQLIHQNTQQILNNYHWADCCLAGFCWLCEGIFQKDYLNATVKEILSLIEAKGFDNSQQFKLNIRIPMIIILKTAFLTRYVYEELAQRSTEAECLKYYNILVLPLESNKAVECKVVLKWIISNELNNITKMTSTSEDSFDNLTISIDQHYNNNKVESAVMKRFNFLLGLEKRLKSKNKGKKVDLGNQDEFKCTSVNVNKILQLKQQDYKSVIEKISSREQFLCILQGDDPKCTNISHKIALHTRNIYLCGRYIKFSRYLSQTPWYVHGKKLTEGSLQEQIQDKIYHLFYPQKSKADVQILFHSGGREDIDVRMLKGGRPFVLQFVNPIKCLKNIKEEQVMKLIEEEKRSKILEEFGVWESSLSKNMLDEERHSRRIAKLLELVINKDNQYVNVLDLQQTNESYISIQLKAAETDKIKHYLCYIYSIQPITQHDKNLLESQKDIAINQQTPIRVLHRRSQLVREKKVFKLKMHLVSQHSAILQVWASAGTYIKQFVHGDLGRTKPNVGSLLGKDVDILQLDVGSLKEGDWKEGDEDLMSMEKFEWMD